MRCRRCSASHWSPAASCRRAFLCPDGFRPGRQAAHMAGLFYMQEPSAQLPAALLRAVPGEAVLDLCAAPGGKAGQLAAHLQNTGLLVANEPVPGRAAVLQRTLERLGVSNAVVTCMRPDALCEALPARLTRCSSTPPVPEKACSAANPRPSPTGRRRTWPPAPRARAPFWRVPPPRYGRAGGWYIPPAHSPLTKTNGRWSPFCARTRTFPCTKRTGSIRTPRPAKGSLPPCSRAPAPARRRRSGQ